MRSQDANRKALPLAGAAAETLVSHPRSPGDVPTPAGREKKSDPPHPFSGDFAQLKDALWDTTGYFYNRWIAYSLDSGIEVAAYRDAETGRRQVRVTALRESPNRQAVKHDVERLALAFPITGWIEERTVTPLRVRKVWSEPVAPAPAGESHT